MSEAAMELFLVVKQVKFVEDHRVSGRQNCSNSRVSNRIYKLRGSLVFTLGLPQAASYGESVRTIIK
jgi:hypothetical protein